MYRWNVFLTGSWLSLGLVEDVTKARQAPRRPAVTANETREANTKLASQLSCFVTLEETDLAIFAL
jgi:hypothetical protein